MEKDYKKAKEWFKKSSEQGVSESTTMLGIMYLQGLGVEVDKEKAKELLIKAKTMRNIT